MISLYCASGLSLCTNLASAPVKTTVRNIRAFQDGDKVFLQTVYNFAGAGEQVAFDIFRFDTDGKICGKTHMVLAEGNYGLAVSEGSFGGAHTSYYDLFRIENGKIAEHWDVMETIADQSAWQNENGKF